MLGWWVVTSVLFLSTPAMAHVVASAAVEIGPVEAAPPHVTIVAAAAPALDGLGTLMAATTAAAILMARRRRAVALACMALLLVVAFESGVHSVHHLTDAPDSHCVVASASTHIGGLGVATVAVDRPAETITAVAVTPAGAPTARPAAPDRGRAPPRV